MVLTTVEEDRAPEEARYLLSRTRQDEFQSSSRAIIELITTIMTYRFEQLSRREIEAMLDITLKETRVYREIKEEATLNLVIRQLTKQFGELSEEIRSTISELSLPVLEALSEALLDFTSLDDLQNWLAEHR